MTRRWKVAAAVALAVLGVVALLAQRRPPAAPPPASVASELELAPSDVATAAPRELRRTLEVTGTLKAVDWAMVKARVAAEVDRLDVREGDPVRVGQRLGQLNGTEYALKLKQAQQQAASAQAQLDIAERALQNNRALVGQGFISQNALDTSISNAAAARATLQAATAAADLARKALNDTVLRAPIAGWVSQRLVQPGERVAVDAKLIEIVDLSRLEIEATVPAQELVSLQPGAVATLRVEGVATPVTARVARIGPSAQAGTRAVPVYLAVDGQAGLRQGLFAQGEIEVERRTALALPASAVRIDQARPYAIALEDGKAVARPLELGRRDGVVGADGEALVEVLAGLSDGATVLRGSVGTVREGTRLRLAGTATSHSASASAGVSATTR